MKRARRPRIGSVLTSLLMISLWAMLASYGQDKPASTDPVMRAMTDELDRSMTQLQFKDLDKPYFIQYITLDDDQYDAEATFGALVSSRESRQRVLYAQVRVGSYTFDNSEFVTGPGGASTGVVEEAVLDNDYDGIRHGFWLATDAAYKQSVEVLARKRAFVENKIQNEPLPDFSHEHPTQVVGERGKLEFDHAAMEKQL